MIKDRSIKIAFDKISGELLEADQIFDDKKDGFILRKQFHTDEVELYCCECDQKLNVSTSKYDRLHFKHQPKSNDCILKSEGISPEELEKITKILIAKESDRHFELKNKIGQKLSMVQGVDPQSIAIDNKFIIRGNDKRKPDVYCKYNDKELVFEIQLSDLSLRYILSRYEFYRKHGMFLIWILDNFNIHGQTQLERDIKYLTEYQNFFKLDEDSEQFRLACDYKFVFLTPENKLITKWINKSLALTEIKFSYESYQIYYYDFGSHKANLEEKQNMIFNEKREVEKIRFEEQWSANTIPKINKIIDTIKNFKNRHAYSYTQVTKLINNLDDAEISLLNQKLNLIASKSRKPPVNLWIETAKEKDETFLEFILTCEEIEFDITALDSQERSAFQEVISNTNLLNPKSVLIELVKRGYKLRTEDEQSFMNWIHDEAEIKRELSLFRHANELVNRDLVSLMFSHSNLIHIIDSSKSGEIIGFKYKPTEWIAFANNSIEHYKEYWEYIEIAFKHYGLWDKLIILDKKGTFQRKLEQLYKNMPPQNFDCDRLIEALYPEIF
ncbi:MAG: DUF6035 family protein [Bacteroidetes bacterium]|nr:DUF6035 family protein [Bacteroidota bacterium]